MKNGNQMLSAIRLQCSVCIIVLPFARNGAEWPRVAISTLVFQESHCCSVLKETGNGASSFPSRTCTFAICPLLLPQPLLSPHSGEVFFVDRGLLSEIKWCTLNWNSPFSHLTAHLVINNNSLVIPAMTHITPPQSIVNRRTRSSISEFWCRSRYRL